MAETRDDMDMERDVVGMGIEELDDAEAGGAKVK